MRCRIFLLIFAVTCCCCKLYSQQSFQDSVKKTPIRKNVIRYNLSGALLFGVDKYIVFGYERVVNPHQSFSINIGRASLPKVISISTDSFDLSKNVTSSGFNASVDYRFYLGKENRWAPPHGLYIGPFYSYNNYKRDNQWDYHNSTAQSYVKTNSTLTINTVGFELGYQFILWKRFALDMVMIGPGLGFYRYKVKFESNVDAETKEQLFDAMKQLITQKFPGMNYVFADKEFDANGAMRTNTIGFRYIIHIGYNF